MFAWSPLAFSGQSVIPNRAITQFFSILSRMKLGMGLLANFVPPGGVSQGWSAYSRLFGWASSAMNTYIHTLETA